MADDSLSQKQRVTLVGALANLGLAAFKTLFGIVGQSQALVADGVHSLSDLISDVLVLGAARLGSQSADQNHPYGHQRFETVATVGIGILLLVVAGGFIYDATARLLNPQELFLPSWFVLPIAIASVLTKEVVYQYTIAVGRRTKSKLIEANAWHHRSDALSSLVVIVGVVGALAGYPWFDALAAIIVAVMIGIMGWRFFWNALRELVDTGLEREQLVALARAIDEVEGVYSHHDLRTRRMGDLVLVDVHIVVDGQITVSEGHRIGERVRHNLLQNLHDDAEVLIHLDPAPMIPNDGA